MRLIKFKALLVTVGLFLFVSEAVGCDFYNLSSGGLKIYCNDLNAKSTISIKYRNQEEKIISQIKILKRTLGKLPMSTLEIYILPSNYITQNSAGKINGFFNSGRIFLVSSRENKLDFNEKTLFHELVHLAVYKLSAGNAPTWIDEGLAQYLSESNSKDRIVKDDSCRIQSYTGNPLKLCNPKAFYSMSSHSVEKLISRFGISKMLKFLELLPTNTDFQLTFKRHFGSKVANDSLFSKHSFYKKSYL